MKGQGLLRTLGLPSFRPLPGLSHAHVQTIAGTFAYHGPSIPPQATHRISLADGDTLVVLENSPPNWTPGGRIIVLVHGLTGCHESGYMKRLARLFYHNGFKVIRVNLRGCGPGFGLARLPYHSGRSADTRALVQWLAQRYTAAPVTQIGVSLGGNITLKMAGEDAQTPSGHLDSVIAVSPPTDLEACAARLARRQNWLFDYYFVAKLRAQVTRLQQHYPDMAPPAFPRRMRLRDFDEHFTAPYSGFTGASDYYTQSSCLPFIPRIEVPHLILAAMDDPVIDNSFLLHDRLSPHTELVLTKAGGHVGFLGRSPQGFGSRWMDCLLLRWVLRHHAACKVGPREALLAT